ncbi:hypothetical protein [Chondrinema litorale]|uniref:hypothetical protein n=1 Tax=Chondrinema litorale TaxID=2994555 RepID=UPI002542BDC4|nr:hypothetical protein [Chondrinema litorale]UZR95950.1 hypothetical protein OQ292_09005 [Chondrinema litorale]
MRKLAILPVDKYLYKFIKCKGNFQSGMLVVDNKLKLPDIKDFHQSTRYFSHMGGKSNLKVFMDNPNKRKLYKLYIFYRELFRQQMHEHIERDTHLGLKANASLCEFLDLYNITESEFKMERGKKSWQRYKERSNAQVFS